MQASGALDIPRNIRDFAATIELEGLRLSGVYYCYSRLRGNWCLRLPSIPEAAMFHAVIEGSCTIATKAATFELQAGDFAMVLRDKGHHIASVVPGPPVDLLSLQRKPSGDAYETLDYGEGDVKCRVLCGAVRFHHPLGSSLLAALPPVLLARNLDQSGSSFLEMLHSLIEGEVTRQDFGNELIVCKLADILVIKAIQEWRSNAGGPKQLHLSPMADRVVGKVLRLLHAEPEADWTLEEIAKRVPLSRAAVSARFSRLVGMPPMKYLTHLRLGIAFDKLSSGGVGVSAVASSVGFSSESAFRRAFKEIYGVSPSALRQRHGH